MGHNHQPKFSQLQVLIAVADSGSFSEAALQLQMSQSAISYAIAMLEEELGVVLLSRGRYGAHLTPVGEQIINRARQITYLMDDILKQANLAKGLRGGQIRISAFRSAATHLLPEVIAEFCRCYAAIAVRIAEYDDSPQVEEDLRKGRADIGITYLPTQPEFESWELLQDEFVVLLPPQFELNEPLSWQTLTQHPLIMAPAGDVCDAMVYEHCAQYGIALQPTYQVRSDATIVNMVAQGLGAAISPRLAAEPIPATVRVRSLPTPLWRSISVTIFADAMLPPAAFAFIDLLKAKLKPKKSCYVMPERPKTNLTQPL
ncbi:MAG: LysR family transcriptional regulator [Leptolyngbyaceae cyanobacterium SM1_1_3]|nr:LysR family transcriptional regulator [Leptolyngbyaceae cyanobacterium SM1_1_3]NJN04211.1 LysR family transcriptional regulator [Leptolyngbyaceae cyanobacterium RM1_1_2]NJO08339.1 LysR family transcriptional regulator [Leptolyngbyaceae cyanobacterium SL_1_1]